MSCTEIYAFDKAGNAGLFGETGNSWRGAMAVWRIMEARHLPQYIPEHVKHMSRYRPGMTPAELEGMLGYRPSRTSAPPGPEDPTKEIWELAGNPKIPRHERIVLFTTFDNALVKREHFQEVIDAFRAFGGITSLPEQAEILEKMLLQESIIAAGWNQTSVNADTWANAGGYNEEAEEEILYNCLTGTRHYWIFDEIDTEAK